MARMFGTDGVRGVAGSELTIELATKLGQAGAYVLTKRDGTSGDNHCRMRYQNIGRNACQRVDGGNLFRGCKRHFCGGYADAGDCLSDKKA